MKKLLAGMFVLAFCILGITKDVQADVIWEPEDSFYKMHAEECEYHNRNYIANGPEGKVTVYKSPEVNLKITTLENGTRVHVDYLYETKDGVLWGIYDNWEENVTGWMPMDYMNLEYDHICFMEEFGNEVQSKEELLPQEYVGKEIYIWSYPGSERNSTFVPQDQIEFSNVFEDEEGNTWGHVGYYYGWRNIWVCIDNPQGEFSELYLEEVPVREVPAEDKIPSTEEIIPEKGLLGTVVSIAVLLVVVVFVTWKLLRKMKKESVHE